jgi:predicted ribosomally synthesized peptide with nif11-like leader
MRKYSYIYAAHINYMESIKKKGEKTMGKMQELYEKVAKDGDLQEKFNAIMNESEKAGEAATGEKLIAFAKDAGFDATLDEMQDFFKKLAESNEGELSDAELDMVAGGKSRGGIFNIIGSAATLGLGCAIGSAQAELAHAIDKGSTSCSGAFR